MKYIKYCVSLLLAFIAGLEISAIGMWIIFLSAMRDPHTEQRRTSYRDEDY